METVLLILLPHWVLWKWTQSSSRGILVGSNYQQKGAEIATHVLLSGLRSCVRSSNFLNLTKRFLEHSQPVQLSWRGWKHFYSCCKVGLSNMAVCGGLTHSLFTGSLEWTFDELQFLGLIFPLCRLEIRFEMQNICITAFSIIIAHTS